MNNIPIIHEDCVFLQNLTITKTVSTHEQLGGKWVLTHWTCIGRMSQFQNSRVNISNLYYCVIEINEWNIKTKQNSKENLII